MQSIPEVRLPLEPDLPTKYVTPKKDPYVALTNDQCEHSDQGHHLDQDGEEHAGNIDAKQFLGGIGRRELTRGVLPKARPEHIETITEETETNIYSIDDNDNDDIRPRHRSPIRRKELPGLIEATRRRPEALTSVTHESSVPSLPFTAKLAMRTASSLQKALEDTYQKIDEESRELDGLIQQGDASDEAPPIPERDVHHHARPRKPRSTEKFIYVKRNMPRVETNLSIHKPLPPEPLSMASAEPEEHSAAGPSQPKRAPLRPLPNGDQKNAVDELSKAEEMLKDLDVFLNDHDDANIADRDVIKGLQVAIHAAADDLYDGYIRHKTGLRIRRFLADLKSFEDISELGVPTNQRNGRNRDENRDKDMDDNNKGKNLEGARDPHHYR